MTLVENIFNWEKRTRFYLLVDYWVEKWARDTAETTIAAKEASGGQPGTN